MNTTNRDTPLYVLLIVNLALSLVSLVLLARLSITAPVVITSPIQTPTATPTWIPSRTPTRTPSPTLPATSWPTPTQEVEPTPTPTPEPCRVEVMPGITSLHLRELPDLNSQIIMHLRAGMQVDVFEMRVVGSGNDAMKWYRVGGFGERGWLAAHFVFRVGDCSQLDK